MLQVNRTASKMSEKHEKYHPGGSDEELSPESDSRKNKENIR